MELDKMEKFKINIIIDIKSKFLTISKVIKDI